MKRSPAIVLLCLPMLAAALPATAQEGLRLGLKAGYGAPSTDVTTDAQAVKEADASGGIVAGLALEGQLYKAWTLETEVLYARREASALFFGGMNDQGNPQGDISSEYTFDTIEIPFHVKYRFPQGDFRPFVFAGWNTIIPVSIDATNTADGVSSKENVKSQFSSVWLALELGVGFDYRLGATTALTADARYSYGLTDTAAMGNTEWKWREWRILAGLKFDL